MNSVIMGLILKIIQMVCNEEIVNEIAKSLVDKLEELAERTDNPIDDYLVSLIKSLIK